MSSPAAGARALRGTASAGSTRVQLGSRAREALKPLGRRRLQDVFAADLRSLAAFRIAIALVVLVDVADRVSNLTAHYTDAGVLPRADLIAHRDILDSTIFSINLISGAALVQAILFAIAALAAGALLVGYATRVTTLIVWLLVVSFEWRNPLVGGGGEILIRILLFWGMFLPLGAVWSIDRLRQRSGPPASMRFVSVPTVALFLQIAFVYWFAFLLKSGPEWRFDGTALSYALNVQQLARPLGSFLLQFPALLTVLTFAVLALEGLGPFLLFSPFRNGPVRTLGVALFMGFQLGIWLTLGMGIFPAVAGLTMVCFLPEWFWDRVKRLTPGRLRARAQRSEPAAPPPRTSRALSLAAGVLIVFVLFWNITTVTPLRVPSPLRHVGFYLGIGQKWDMFAPSPLRDDGWYVMPATLNDGRTVDAAGVLRGETALRRLSWRKPAYIRGTYDGERWRKYLETLRFHYPGQHLYLARYICRVWNDRHPGPERMVTLVIGYMAQRIQPDGKRSAPALRMLRAQQCQ